MSRQTVNLIPLGKHCRFNSYCADHFMTTQDAQLLVRGQKIREIKTGEIFDFAHIGQTGFVCAYVEGECNMQDMVAFKPDKIETIKPKKNVKK